MPELSGVTPTPRAKDPTVRVARLAARQWGVVSRAQLERRGLSGTGISRWVASGRLHRVHRGVYAVGHPALGIEGRLAAALLFAGPDAMLSHSTAGWWWRILPERPQMIHLSAAGDRRSTPRVAMHHPRSLEGTRHRGLPVTTVARTLLDCAAALPFAALRRAVAEADYLRLLDPDAVAALVGRGHPGSATLNRALRRHRPEFARTLSALEERFLDLCDASGIPLPEVNVKVEGLMVDALWREQRIIVELDGHAAHGTAFTVERDRRRELTLRSAGFLVLRYTWQQITHESDKVARDLKAALGL